MSQLDFSTLIQKGKQVIVAVTSQPIDSELLNGALKQPNVTVVTDNQDLYKNLLPYKANHELLPKITEDNVVKKVILLMRDEKRVKHVEEHLKPIFPTLQTSPAVDAMTPHAIDSFVRTNQTPILKPIKAGKIGCIFSHLTVWNEFLNSQHAAMLVLEDDTVPEDDFHVHFREVLKELPPTFDLLYLHLDSAKNYNLRSGVSYSKLLKKNVPREDTCAYLISRKGASKMIKLLRTIRDQLGSTLRKQIENGGLETYTVKHALFSNIGQKAYNLSLSQGMLKSNTVNSRLYVPDEHDDE